MPKTESPTIKDYRPIASCNVAFKCISKILANRIQPVLSHLISPFQSAFLKGRSIRDNILLMQELVKNYHLNKGIPRCAMKMDLMKAYDSVAWDFLFEVMAIMEFPSPFISWVRQCVTTAMFSVVLNGELVGYFPGKRGLRQGDPLSPYLFLLILEALTAMLTYRTHHMAFTFHPKCQALNISHLIFDDLFILSGADTNSFQVVKDVFYEFNKVSGLQPNLQKSSMVYAGVSQQDKEGLYGVFAIPEGFLPVKYLGVPFITTRLKAQDCEMLLEKILQKVHSWSSKLLSYGGRLQLINAVLFSIQVYWCSTFILPFKMLSKFESTLKAFFWTGSDLRTTGAKVNWKSVCKPKEEGGLGIRLLEEWNKASMVKHIWAYMSESRYFMG